MRMPICKIIITAVSATACFAQMSPQLEQQLRQSLPAGAQDQLDYGLRHDLDALSRILGRHGLAKQASVLKTPNVRGYFLVLHAGAYAAAMREHPFGRLGTPSQYLLSDAEHAKVLARMQHEATRLNGGDDTGLAIRRATLSGEELVAAREIILRIGQGLGQQVPGVNQIKQQLDMWQSSEVAGHPEGQKLVTALKQSLRAAELLQSELTELDRLLAKDVLPGVDATASTDPNGAHATSMGASQQIPPGAHDAESAIPSGLQIPEGAEIASGAFAGADFATIQSGNQTVQLIAYANDTIVVKSSETVVGPVIHNMFTDEVTTVTIETTAVFGPNDELQLGGSQANATTFEYVTVGPAQIGMTHQLNVDSALAAPGFGGMNDIGAFVGAGVSVSSGVNVVNTESGASQSLQLDIGTGGGIGLHSHDHGTFGTDGSHDFSLAGDYFGVVSGSASQIGGQVDVKGSLGPIGVQATFVNPLAAPSSDFPSVNLSPVVIEHINNALR